MWSLVYEIGRCFVIGFYNILDRTQSRALAEKIRSFTTQHQLFILLVNRAVRT